MGGIFGVVQVGGDVIYKTGPTAVEVVWLGACDHASLASQKLTLLSKVDLWLFVLDIYDIWVFRVDQSQHG